MLLLFSFRGSTGGIGKTVRRTDPRLIFLGASVGWIAVIPESRTSRKTAS